MPGTSHHKTQAKSHKTPGFEAALAELEQVVADMESGKLSLEDSLAAYKRGANCCNPAVAAWKMRSSRCACWKRGR